MAEEDVKKEEKAEAGAEKAAEKKAEPPKPKFAPPKLNPVEETLKMAFGDAVQTGYDVQGDLEVKVRADRLRAVCLALRDNAAARYNLLRNVTAVDWKDRIEMIYNVCCVETVTNVTVRCDLPRENPAVESVTPVWPGADWQEREVFDLMGVDFEEHPDLRRILLPEEWQGHPLRKDYVMPED